MNNKIEEVLDRMIESLPNGCGFVINIVTKEKYGIPDEYKGYPVGSDVITPFDNIYFIPKP